MKHFFGCSTQEQAPGLAHNRLALFAKDKHSSLLRKSVNYGQKKFYNIGPRPQVWFENSLLFICLIQLNVMFQIQKVTLSLPASCAKYLEGEKENRIFRTDLERHRLIQQVSHEACSSGAHYGSDSSMKASCLASKHQTRLCRQKHSPSH